MESVPMSAQPQVLHPDTPAVWSLVKCGIPWHWTGRTGHEMGNKTQQVIPKQAQVLFK